MFLLKKVFQFRDHANPEEEKPFLEHLEDLRILVSRLGVTLLLSTLLCFVFKAQLMNILRKPVEDVWVTKQESTLPKDVSLDNWERSLELADAAAGLETLSPALASAFWDDTAKDGERTLSQAAIIYRAAKLIPEKERGPFLEKITAEKPELKDRVEALLKLEPQTDLNKNGNLRLMSSFQPTETFMLTMKLAFFAGIVISFPLLLYFLLQFIVPGLKKEERKILWPALAIGFGLFIMGVLFAYFLVLPEVLTFFYEWGQGIGISNDWRIGYYISFATQFVLIFGLAFELPVVVMALVYLGILNFTMMSSTRSYAIITIMIVAAIITPTPDMATLALLAVPMYLLYEMCIWLAYFYEKKQNRMEAEEEKERTERLLSFKDAEPEGEPEGDSIDLYEEPDPDEDRDPFSNDPDEDRARDSLDDGLLDEAEDEEFDHSKLSEEGEEMDIGDPVDPADLIDVTVNREENPNHDPLALDNYKHKPQDDDKPEPENPDKDENLDK